MAKKTPLTPNQFLARVDKALQQYKPAIEFAKAEIAGEAKVHFDRSFSKEGFTDTSLVKWPKRSPDRRPYDKTLYETGKLSSSTRARVIARGVTIINNTPYAGYHNYGKGQKVRRFIGPSTYLNKRIVIIITSNIKRIFEK